MKRLSRSEHLRQWVGAIERHKPGAEDEALGVFDAWQSDSLAYLAIDIDTLLKLISLSADPNGASRPAAGIGSTCASEDERRP